MGRPVDHVRQPEIFHISAMPRNGLAMQLATYPPSLEGAATVEYGDTFCLVGGYNTGTN